MISKDFFSALNDLEEQKNINKEEFIKILEAALTSAYKKNFGEAKSAFVKLMPEKNTIKIYAYKTIVENVEDPEKQISLEDAKKIKGSYKLGDLVTEEVVPKEDFGRIAAQTAKHIIMQRIHEAEKEKLLQEINGKENEIVLFGRRNRIVGVFRRNDNSCLLRVRGKRRIDAYSVAYRRNFHSHKRKRQPDRAMPHDCFQRVLRNNIIRIQILRRDGDLSRNVYAYGGSFAYSLA